MRAQRAFNRKKGTRGRNNARSKRRSSRYTQQAPYKIVIPISRSIKLTVSRALPRIHVSIPISTSILQHIHIYTHIFLESVDSLEFNKNYYRQICKLFSNILNICWLPRMASYLLFIKYIILNTKSTAYTYCYISSFKFLENRDYK